MKFTFHLILIALFVAFAFAATATDEKQVIFNYPGDTPDSVIQQAIKALEAAVSHHYTWHLYLGTMKGGLEG
jgi:hypothetical protein